LLSPNTDRNIVSGKSRGLDREGEAAHLAADAIRTDASGERSGSRLHLDASFRKVTRVGAYQPSFHRSDRIR
jgi:hypothetical protein